MTVKTGLNDCIESDKRDFALGYGALAMSELAEAYFRALQRYSVDFNVR
jgi:hypothetical protein